MVVTLRWMESWTVVIVSIGVLTLIVVILLSCVCWDKHRTKLRQFVVLDEKGVKRIFFPEAHDKRPGGFFKQFSKTNIKPKFLKCEEGKSELHQSIEISDAFDHAVLQIEKHEEDEDVLSCMSNDSVHTFYSTYPMIRTTSTLDAIKGSK